jgi:GTP-binding protein
LQQSVTMIDQVKIYVKSGDGGAGAVAFRREKYVPKGGPAGGDGGRGGSIVLRVNPKLNTLSPFAKKIHFKAANGERGMSSNKSGAGAKDVIIDVPPGTVVRDAASDEVLADLVEADETVVVAPGGRGGRGNQHFVTASRQAPRVAEKGEPGIERWLVLELKLIADVGIVGVPNAGKSTLLSVISNARPKIADYPFTTLEPNLGVVTYDDSDLVVADIPGLIEGAHLGVGLGHAFLRHVQRTRFLVHVLNGASENPLADYNQINVELSLYDERLKDRPQIVVFNKMDLPEAQARWPAIQSELRARGVEPLAMSGATQRGVQTLVQRMFALAEALPKRRPPVETPLYSLADAADIPFTVARETEGVYRVSGKRIERAASMTYWEYEEAVYRFQRILETLGVTAALREAGVEEGDTVLIGTHELEWSE